MACQDNAKVTCTVEKTMGGSKNKSLFWSKSILTEGQTLTSTSQRSAIWAGKEVSRERRRSKNHEGGGQNCICE